MLIARWRGPFVAACAAAALLAAGSPASALGPAGNHRSVVNGAVVSRPATVVPWAVSLYYGEWSDSTPRFICTATAIGPLEVLTAAHCVDEPGFYYVRVGSNVLDHGRLVAIEAVDGNAAYRSSTTTSDVAMLRPLERLDLTAYARLASPTMAAAVRSGRLPALTLYGWGMTERGDLTGQLRTASLVRQTRAAQERFKGAFVDQTMLSAGRYNPATHLYSGACYGDSGGPLVVHVLGVPYVVGITSFGARDCNSPVPTVFTSVGNYATWLAASRRGLPARALHHNRALPVLRSAPSVTGTITVGATLTCRPGSWTLNARVLSYTWLRGPSYGEVGTGAQYVVSRADAGRKLMCSVHAMSDAGDATAAASVTAGLLPSPVFGQSVQISGQSDYTDPQPDRVVSCTSPAFEPAGAVVTRAWYTQAVGADRQPLGTAPAVQLTKDLMLALQNQRLICELTATDSMGSTVVSASIGLPGLGTPAVTATVAPVPIAAGSTATCAAVSSKPAAALTYEWAIDPAWMPGAGFSASAQPVGAGPTYTMTDGDVAALASGKLACRATATTWYAAGSAVTVLAP